MRTESQEIADYFFAQTERRATQQMYVQTLSSANILLTAGYKIDEIKKGIDHCIVNPPPKGFMSLHWLTYDLENILYKIKIKEKASELAKHDKNILPEMNVSNASTKHEKNKIKDFEFNIFESEE